MNHVLRVVSAAMNPSPERDAKKGADLNLLLFSLLAVSPKRLITPIIKVAAADQGEVAAVHFPLVPQ